MFDVHDDVDGAFVVLSKAVHDGAHRYAALNCKGKHVEDFQHRHEFV